MKRRQFAALAAASLAAPAVLAQIASQARNVLQR